MEGYEMMRRTEASQSGGEKSLFAILVSDSERIRKYVCFGSFVAIIWSALA